MSKNSLGNNISKYYQDNKKTTKKLVKDIKVFLKYKKKKKKKATIRS